MGFLDENVFLNFWIEKMSEFYQDWRLTVTDVFYSCVQCFFTHDFILKHWDSTINNWDLVKRELIFDEMWEYSAHPHATLPSTRGISPNKRMGN